MQSVHQYCFVMCFSFFAPLPAIWPIVCDDREAYTHAFNTAGHTHVGSWISICLYIWFKQIALKFVMNRGECMSLLQCISVAVDANYGIAARGILCIIIMYGTLAECFLFCFNWISIIYFSDEVECGICVCTFYRNASCFMRVKNYKH